jgi:protein disulfide-isomerase
MRHGASLVVIAGLLAGVAAWSAASTNAPPAGRNKNPVAPPIQLPWFTNFADAKKAAETRKLPLFVYFSDSDGAGLCAKFDAEVLSQAAFNAFAAKEVGLFKADFPRRRPQSSVLKAQNEGLARQFGVDGFPTVLLVNPDGTVIAQTGYREDGAEAYVEYLRGLLRGE